VASTVAGNRGHEKPGTAAWQQCQVAWSLRAGPGNGDGGGTWADNATAERREACLPVAREGSCLASVASRVTARHVSRLDVSGRSANPLTRGSAATKAKRKKEKRIRRQNEPGPKKTALFEIVNRKHVARMERSEIRGRCRMEGRPALRRSMRATNCVQRQRARSRPSARVGAPFAGPLALAKGAALPI